MKKVSQLRTSRRKSNSRTFDRSTQSMDLGSKTLSMVDVRSHHESLDQERGCGEFSSCHTSLPSAPSGLPRTDRLPASAASPTPVADGLPSAMDHFHATVLSGARSTAQRTELPIPPTVPITRHTDLTRPAAEGLPATAGTSATPTRILPSRSIHADGAPQRNAQQVS